MRESGEGAREDWRNKEKVGGMREFGEGECERGRGGGHLLGSSWNINLL